MHTACTHTRTEPSGPVQHGRRVGTPGEAGLGLLGCGAAAAVCWACSMACSCSSCIMWFCPAALCCACKACYSQNAPVRCRACGKRIDLHACGTCSQAPTVRSIRRMCRVGAWQVVRMLHGIGKRHTSRPACFRPVNNLTVMSLPEVVSHEHFYRLA